MIHRLLNRPLMRQRPNSNPLIRPPPNLHPPNPLTQRLRKLIIYPLLHHNAIRSHTRLPGIPQLRNNTRLHRRLDLRIVKDNKRTIATELQTHFLDRASAVSREDLADSRTTCEADFFDFLVGAELLAYFGDKIKRCDDIDGSSWEASFVSEDRLSQGTEGSFAGWFPDLNIKSLHISHLIIQLYISGPSSNLREGDSIRFKTHSRTPRRQRRPNLPRNHRNGEIPRRQTSRHAQRLLKCHNSLIDIRTRYNLSIRPLGLACKPL